MIYFGIAKGTGYLIFVTISFIIATTVKYIADKFWAFEKAEREQMGSELSRFFIITLISWGIQVGIAGLVVNTMGSQLGMSPLVLGNIGKIAGIAVASAWNFVGYKFIVFKK
jgi:putative flippase GtrA